MTRLGDVVQQRAPAQRAAARELVGERLGEQRARRPRARSAAERPPPGRAASAIVSLEHLERVPVDVEVVVDGLLDPAQRLELGQHDRRRAELVEQREPVERGRGVDDRRAARAKTRSAETPLEPRRALARRGDASRRRRRSPARRRGARRAGRAAGRRRTLAGATIRSRRAREIGEPARRVDRLAAGERLGDRVDRQVALPQVGLERAALERAEVDLPAAARARRRARRRTPRRARTPRVPRGAAARSARRRRGGVARRRRGRGPAPPGARARAGGRAPRRPTSHASRPASAARASASGSAGARVTPRGTCSRGHAGAPIPHVTS